MKKKTVNEYPNWKAIHFLDRTILKSDTTYMSGMQKEQLGKVQIDHESKGHLFVEGTI